MGEWRGNGGGGRGGDKYQNKCNNVMNDNAGKFGGGRGCEVVRAEDILVRARAPTALIWHLFSYVLDRTRLICGRCAFKCSSACRRGGVSVCASERGRRRERVCASVCVSTVYAVKLELIKGSVKQRECNYQT